MGGDPNPGDAYLPDGDATPGDDFAPGDDLTPGDDLAPGGDELEGDVDPGDHLPPGDDTEGDEDLPVACSFYGIDGAGDLWEIDPLTPSASSVGNTQIQNLTDIAIFPDGRMLAHTTKAVYQLSPSTAAATLLSAGDPALEVFSPVAADAADESTLLVGGARDVGTWDLLTGKFVSLGDFLPPGWAFAGDLAMLDEISLYATAKQSGQPDHLFYINLDTREVVDQGSLGTDKVWGLDYGCDGELYGLVTNEPLEVIRITPSQPPLVESMGTITGPATLWGAAGPAGQ